MVSTSVSHSRTRLVAFLRPWLNLCLLRWLNCSLRRVRSFILLSWYFLDICLTVIPDVTDISWREWNTDVNLTKDNIMVTFIKGWNINSIIWNCILVRTKWKVNGWHFVMLLWVGLSIICLHPADDVRQSISWRVDWEIFCHHFEQRALKSPVATEHKGNSWSTLLRSKSNLIQKSSDSSWLWLGSLRWSALTKLYRSFEILSSLN